MPGLLDLLNLNPADPRTAGLLNQRMLDPTSLQNLQPSAAPSSSGDIPAAPPYGVANMLPGSSVPGSRASASGFLPQQQSLMSPSQGDATMSPGRPPNFAPKPQGFANLKLSTAPDTGPSAGMPVPGLLGSAPSKDPSAAMARPMSLLPVFAQRDPSGLLGALRTRSIDGGSNAVPATPTSDDDDKPAPNAAPAAGIGTPGAPMNIQSAAQTATPAAEPSFMDKLGTAIGGIYGAGGPGDGLIALGAGLMSGQGVGKGLMSGMQLINQQKQSTFNNQLQQSTLDLQKAKFAQSQQGQQALIPLVRDRLAKANGGVAPSDAAVQAVLSNPSAMASITSTLMKSPEQEKADKAQLVDVPQPDGSTQKQWVTPGSSTGTAVGAPAPAKQPDAVRDVQYARQNWQALGLPDPAAPANAQYWSDLTAKRLGGGGVSVSTNLPPVEKAEDQAFGKAAGEHFGSILKAGDDARQTQGQLQFMNDAFKSGGSNITTGPAAKAVLGAKQLVQGLTGIDLAGVPESEAVNKLGFGLATSLVQDISKRGGTQAEFIRGLQNVPGIFMSPAGSRVMMSILNQQAQAKIDLGQLVQDPANRRSWAKTEDGYYASHPLISPFTGKPLSKGDLESLRAAATAASIDPATGTPATSQGGAAPASIAPAWSIVGN